MFTKVLRGSRKTLGGCAKHGARMRRTEAHARARGSYRGLYHTLCGLHRRCVSEEPQTGLHNAIVVYFMDSSPMHARESAEKQFHTLCRQNFIWYDCVLLTRLENLSDEHQCDTLKRWRWPSSAAANVTNPIAQARKQSIMHYLKWHSTRNAHLAGWFRLCSTSSCICGASVHAG
jgi:hypothetical protein